MFVEHRSHSVKKLSYLTNRVVLQLLLDIFQFAWLGGPCRWIPHNLVYFKVPMVSLLSRDRDLSLREMQLPMSFFPCHISAGTARKKGLVSIPVTGLTSKADE